MSKKGENIYKRKDGRWEGRYIKGYETDGKIRYGYIYAKSYSDAKNKLLLAKVSTTGKSSGNKDINGNITYQELTEKWLNYTRLHVKESTYVRYKATIENHLIPAIGDYKLRRINTKLMENLVHTMKTNGRLDGTGGLSPKTISDTITIIKSIFNYARYNDYEVNCNLKMLSIKKECPEISVISHEEQMLLKKLLICDIDLCKAGVLLSMYTGIRIGELCALKWENIDLENKVLTVMCTMQRVKITEYESSPKDSRTIVTGKSDGKTKLIITEPKTKSSIRRIPLQNYIVDILSPFQASADAFFLTGKTDKYIEPRTMQNHFKRYLKDCHMKDINFHALRHTFATRCIELGFEVKSLSEILGHSSVNITLNRYVHSFFELKKQNMNKLLF